MIKMKNLIVVGTIALTLIGGAIGINYAMEMSELSPTAAAYAVPEIPKEYAGTYIEDLPPQMVKHEIEAIEKAVKGQSTYDKYYIMNYRKNALKELRGYGNVYNENVEDFTGRLFAQYLDAIDPTNKFGKPVPDGVVPKNVIDKFVARGLDRDFVIESIIKVGRQVES